MWAKNFPKRHEKFTMVRRSSAASEVRPVRPRPRNYWKKASKCCRFPKRSRSDCTESRLARQYRVSRNTDTHWPVALRSHSTVLTPKHLGSQRGPKLFLT